MLGDMDASATSASWWGEAGKEVVGPCVALAGFHRQLEVEDLATSVPLGICGSAYLSPCGARGSPLPCSCLPPAVCLQLPRAVPPPLPAPVYPWQLFPRLFLSLQVQPRALGTGNAGAAGEKSFSQHNSRASALRLDGTRLLPCVRGGPSGVGEEILPTMANRGIQGCCGRDREGARPVSLCRAEEVMPRWTGCTVLPGEFKPGAAVHINSASVPELYQGKRGTGNAHGRAVGGHPWPQAIPEEGGRALPRCWASLPASRQPASPRHRRPAQGPACCLPAPLPRCGDSPTPQQGCEAQSSPGTHSGAELWPRGVGTPHPVGQSAWPECRCARHVKGASSR